MPRRNPGGVHIPPKTEPKALVGRSAGPLPSLDAVRLPGFFGVPSRVFVPPQLRGDASAWLRGPAGWRKPAAVRVNKNETPGLKV